MQVMGQLGVECEASRVALAFIRESLILLFRVQEREGTANVLLSRYSAIVYLKDMTLCRDNAKQRYENDTKVDRKGSRNE